MSLWSLRSTVNTCRWFNPPPPSEKDFFFIVFLVLFITIRNYFGYKYRFRFLKLYQLFPVLKRQPVTSQQLEQVLNGLFSHLFIEQYFQDFLNQLYISCWNWLWYIHVYKPQGICVKKKPIVYLRRKKNLFPQSYPLF